MFILDIDRVGIGDIILTANKMLLSKSIRRVTGGSFSHAMLYVADHSYIHSDGDGVHSSIRSVDCSSLRERSDDNTESETPMQTDNCEFLPDTKRGVNKSNVYLEFDEGYTLIEARVALNTTTAGGPPHQFHRLQNEDHLTVVYQAVAIPWLRVGYAPRSNPPNPAHDGAMIRDIMGDNCQFID